MSMSIEKRDRFRLRQLGRELAAIGLTSSLSDYVQRWLGGDDGQSIDSVPLTGRLFVQIQFGLMLARLELEGDLSIERDLDISWVISAKRRALGRIEKEYGRWLNDSALFRPDIDR